MADVFPEGRLNDSDQGALNITIGITQRADGKQILVVSFPKDISWFAMPKADAVQLVDMINKAVKDMPDDA